MIPRVPARALAIAAVTITMVTACNPSMLGDLPSAPATGYTVGYVIDGDTIDVTDPAGETQRVRLLGINTAEVGHDGEDAQCGGEEAAAQLEELLPEGTSVELLSDGRADNEDRYGRLLRYVETEDGTDAGAALVTAGYAYAWAPASEPDPERMSDYEDATAAARDAGAGAWANCPNLGESR